MKVEDINIYVNRRDGLMEIPHYISVYPSDHMFGISVSWRTIGAVTPEVARAFANKILEACDIADKLAEEDQ